MGAALLELHPPPHAGAEVAERGGRDVVDVVVGAFDGDARGELPLDVGADFAGFGDAAGDVGADALGQAFGVAPTRRCSPLRGCATAVFPKDRARARPGSVLLKDGRSLVGRALRAAGEDPLCVAQCLMFAGAAAA
jgi:hypothetical protein